MILHEYQAKSLFSAYGIPVEKHILCFSAAEAGAAYDMLQSGVVAVKAQVLAGGRGKAGGVKLTKTREEALQVADTLLKMHIKGLPVEKIIVSEGVDIESEYYLSFTIDRNAKSVLLMISAEGGMDIEEVAAKSPEKILQYHIDPFVGIPDYLARRYAFSLFEDIGLVNQMASVIQKLYRLFIEKDASLTEINPLVKTKANQLMAIDGKMTVDNNALYRQSEISRLFEPTDEEKVEALAKEKGFSYVHLDGEIGCMVNGAGLAMATMDMIKLDGGAPANFLDIGGSSNPDKVIEAMKLLLKDPQVKVVLINIFGGITRCDDVAAGLIVAFDQLQTNVPVVVRLTGTNEREGRAMLANHRVKVAETMSEAVRMAVASQNDRIELP